MSKGSVKSITIGLGFLAIVVLAVIWWRGLSKKVESTSISAIVQKYEYTELIPPSTIITPGSLVTVIKTNPFAIGIICPAIAALGQNVSTNFLTSASANSKEATELTGEFNLDPSIKDKLSISGGTKSVKTIAVTLSNVKIIEIPDSVVFQSIANRQRECASAIKFRMDHGQTVSMIKSVIQATASYRVHFDASLKADAKAEMIRGIAGSLGLTNGIKSDDTIEGEGLIWGIRDDLDLALVNPNAPPPTGAAKHRRALPAGVHVTILPNVQ
jgi:hypothetical protein